MTFPRISPAFLAFLLLIPAAWLHAEPVDFALKDIDGNTLKLSDYRGQWVVVNYWATWCPPCLEEIPELVLFHDQHQGSDAVVVGVNYEMLTPQELKSFVDNYQISYPVVQLDPAGKNPLGTLIGLPTTYLISPQGELVARQMGGVTADMLEEFMADHAEPASAQQASHSAR